MRALRHLAMLAAAAPGSRPLVAAAPTSAMSDVSDGFQPPRVVGFKDALLSLLAPTGNPQDIVVDGALVDMAYSEPSLAEILGHGRADNLGVLLEQRQNNGDSGDGDDGNDDGDEDEDKEELYLCSNPNFDTTCGEGCMCASVPVTTAAMSYGGKPPCAALPYSLRPGNPQGVSSARAYSKWNCTLFAGQYCEEDTPPAETFRIKPGPPGLDSLGGFDDLAQSYRCEAI
ncbi:hypothetical protein Micbo1qcDRAFT_174496 [Microdochium bolleyi]|uniref:Uncharacterized protein n=1 Tax=Microdochium bolleyi TaxID=196109 RepID=A0A136J8J1_9PEZI|nr:hypothetical protein Micbo1qcDRAFT_174496 [Microdochium bolleyi]